MEDQIWIVVNILQGLCLLEGLIFGIYIIFKSKKDNGDLYLGLFLISLVSVYLASFINSSGFINFDYTVESRMWYWPFSFYFAQFPLLYLYLQWLDQRKRFNFQENGKLFIPVLLETFLLLILFLTSSEFRNETISIDQYNAGQSIFMVLVLIFNIYVFLLSMPIIKRYQNKSLVLTYNLRRNITWARYARIYVLVFSSIFVIYWFLPDWDPWLYMGMTFVDLIFIFWIIFFAITQKSTKGLLQSEQFSGQYNQQIEELIEIKVDEFSNVPNELEMIIQKIKLKEYFKNPDLGITDLAKKLHISSKKLSSLINQFTDGNYNAFINGFRVDEVKQIVLSKEFDHLNMEAIAYAVGFKSMATFYRVFKSKTGKSPLELRDEAIKNGEIPRNETPPS